MTKRILFVCMGNICRSPAAEAVMNHCVDSRGLGARVSCDSAATGGWHVGNRADPRMREHLSERGYESTSRARQIEVGDFDAFDLICVMDADNEREVRALARDRSDLAKIRRLTDHCRVHRAKEVPDPYYGGAAGFERVIDLLEDACANLLDELVP